MNIKKDDKVVVLSGKNKVTEQDDWVSWQHSNLLRRI